MATGQSRRVAGLADYPKTESLNIFTAPAPLNPDRGLIPMYDYKNR
jgi:hypothetical protein